MKKFINLTPHIINLNDGRSFPSEGCARVASSHSAFDADGVCSVSYGEVEGLPEERDGVLLIVSAMVAEASKDRRDLVVPATGHPECIRENGRIVSVPGFVRKV